MSPYPGQLHLHPISQTHQLRPSLTYLDFQQRRSKSRRGHEDDDESDEAPPDPDDPGSPPKDKGKEKAKAAPTPAKEIQAAARRVEDAGLSVTRREFLLRMREERSEDWESLKYFDTDVSFFYLES